MKLKLIFLLSSTIYHNPVVNGLDASCPNNYCASDIVNTHPTVDPSVVCPNLQWTSLANYTHNGEMLIELRGPANVENAADLVITAPHGGALWKDDEGVNGIPDRATSGPYCPTSGCKTSKDTGTLEISEKLQQKFIDNYCKVPYLVINHLHRSKLDANREVDEAAQNNGIAIDAWNYFHNLTHYAQVQLQDHFGVTTEQYETDAGSQRTRTGVKSLLFDMHGYAGKDWVPEIGSPFIQWGYRLSDTTLEQCPLTRRTDGSNNTGTIGTLTHARWIEGHSYECLVRGPGSLATRVSELIDAVGGLPGEGAQCGHGLPSNEFPSVQTLIDDPTYCSETGSCYYYSGGFDTEVHERMDWENYDTGFSGYHFNTIQAELPRCVRFGDESVHDVFADKLSVATMSFLRDLYGDMPVVATTTSTTTTSTTTTTTTTTTQAATTTAATTTTTTTTPSSGGTCTGSQAPCIIDSDCSKWCSKAPFSACNQNNDCSGNGAKCLAQTCDNAGPTTTFATTSTTPVCPFCGDGSECCPWVGECESSGNPSSRTCVIN